MVRRRLREKKTMREKLNMPFWQQQLRERNQPSPSHPRLGLKTHPGPCFRCNQSGHWAKACPNLQPPQKHAQPVVSGDTGRWTVPRDALTPLGRSPPPRPEEWNVHRDALAPPGRSPLVPQNPSPTLRKLFQ